MLDKHFSNTNLKATKMKNKDMNVFVCVESSENPIVLFDFISKIIFFFFLRKKGVELFQGASVYVRDTRK